MIKEEWIDAPRYEDYWGPLQPSAPPIESTHVSTSVETDVNIEVSLQKTSSGSFGLWVMAILLAGLGICVLLASWDNSSIIASPPELGYIPVETKRPARNKPAFRAFISHYNGQDPPVGPSGYSCWDLNMNWVCDMATEDINGDFVCTVSDCVVPEVSPKRATKANK